MANEQTTNRELICRAAYSLFLNEGYQETSYSKIANLSGIGRPLVQYYFPKKEELALSFIDRLMETANRLLVDSGQASNLPEVFLGQFGQIYYSFMLRNSQTKRLMLDFLRDRELSSRTIDSNIRYSLSFLDGGEELGSSLIEASIKATGGVYELLYCLLKEDLPVDAISIAQQTTAALLVFSTDATYAEATSRLQEEALDAATIDSICGKLEAELFGAEYRAGEEE